MGLLYDRTIDNGKGQVKKTEIPLDGSKVHITQYDSSTNSRTSWDANGKDVNSADNKHTTNQNEAKGSPDRHNKKW